MAKGENYLMTVKTGRMGEFRGYKINGVRHLPVKSEILEKVLELAKKKEQVIGREQDYYVTLEQLEEIVKG